MRKTKMKNAGEMFLRFGLLSTMNNFRIRFYWTVFHWFWKRSDIREAEVTSPGNQYFLKDLPAARRYVARKVMPEIVWMNEQLPADAKVLCIGDAELFEAQFTPVYNTVFDRSIFEQWCGAGEGDPRTKPLRPLAEIRQTLAAHGITHIYVNWSELLRYRTTYTYTNFVAPERFQALVEGGLVAPPVTPDDAWQRVADLPDSWRSQVESWGQALIREAGGERVIPQWSVYAIRGD